MLKYNVKYSEIAVALYNTELERILTITNLCTMHQIRK